MDIIGRRNNGKGYALKNFFQKDSVIISTLSILSFIAAYLFECGYSDAFGYSHAFIQVDLKVMVISIACLVALFFPLMMYFLVFFSLALRPEKKIRLIALPMILPIPGLIFFYVVGFESTILKLILFLSIFLGLCTFLNVVYKSRKMGWKLAMSEVATANGIKDFGGQPKAGNEKESTVFDRVIGYFFILVVLTVLGLIVRGGWSWRRSLEEYLPDIYFGWRGSGNSFNIW